MRVPARRAAVMAVAMAVLIPAAAAQAKPKTVVMGLGSKTDEFNTKYGSDVNAFFPSKITIRKGGKVKFKAGGFHTLDIPPGGGTALPLLTPQGQVSNVRDAANALFWFNGQGNLQFNPEIATVDNFGKSFTRQGNARIESGLPLAQAPKPITVRFKRKGTFTYFCDVHAGMKGKVVVKGRHAHVPSAKQDKKAVKRQLAAARKRAKKLASFVPTGNNVSVGNSAKGGVEYFGMLPAVKTVPHGTTVTFSMSRLSREVHTATFGPGNPETQPTSYLGVIAASFAGPQIDQRGVYPSENPAGPTASLSPTLHGNGFWSTGAIDRSDDSPLPASGVVTFNTPGTYDFYCMIHPFMHGQIKVT